MLKFALAALLISSPFANASDSERDAILAQGGCYRVTYESRELAAFEPNYPIKGGHFRTGALEIVIPDIVSDDEIVLQHITMFKDQGEMHWGQIWKRAPSQVLAFQGDNVWDTKRVENSSGQWSQFVTQVDMSPRYGCAAPWKISGGVKEWACTSWSPLPRREGNRKDYNVLERNNRHILTHTGWIHHQENRKLMVKDGVVKPVATELTINTYDRVNDAECVVGKTFWEKQGPAWRAVRAAWTDTCSAHPRLQLKNPAAGTKSLWEQLFDLVEEWNKRPLNDSQLRQEAREVIERFVVP